MSKHHSKNHDPQELQNLMEASLGGDVEQLKLSFKDVGNGTQVFTFDIPFSYLTSSGIALLLGEDGRQALVEAGGADFFYQDQSAPKYVLIPESWYHNPNKIRFWCKESISFVREQKS